MLSNIGSEVIVADSWDLDSEQAIEVQEITESEGLELSRQYFDDFSKHIEGYKERSGQRELMEAVVSATASNKVLVAQAGTGTGKTFAYILGALPQVLEAKKRLIISTHTIALQGQLMGQDLPLIHQQIAPELKIEIAKGGTHYFCPKRASELLQKTEDDSQLALTVSADEKINSINAVKEVWNQFQAKEFDGDLDTLTISDPKLIEDKVQRMHNRCAGKRTCSFGDSCPFYQQRARLISADIVVTNHALLSHVLINETSTLGDLSNSMLILDEAHQFHDVFRNYHENSLTLSESEQIDKKLETLNKSISGIYKHYPVAQQDVKDTVVIEVFSKLAPLISEYIEYSQQIDQFLHQNFKTLRGPVTSQFDDAHQWVLGFEATNPELSTLLADWLTITALLEKQLQSMLIRVTTPMEKLYSTAPDKAKQHIQKMGVGIREVLEEVKNTRSCIMRFVAFDQFHLFEDRLDAGLVRWIKYDGKEGSFSLFSNVLDVSEKFRTRVPDQFSSVTLTSATIEAMGTFNFFNTQLGIERIEGHRTLKVSSPFDYRKVSLVAPIQLGDVNRPDYSSKIAAEINMAKQRHKAILVLFSSYKQLNQVYDQCSPALKKDIYRQDEYSKTHLLNEHKLRLDKGQTSILFGVDGLAEGVDLKRHYLTCVMVAKFPFAHLGEPVMKTQSDYLNAKGKNSFVELSLPLCSRKLIQSTGRLIRTEDDYGEIVILDSRVYTKRYANQLINCLPMYY